MGRPRKKTTKKPSRDDAEKDEPAGGLLMSMRSGLKDAVHGDDKPKNKALAMFWNIVTGILILFVAAVWLRRCGVIDWGKPRRGQERQQVPAVVLDAGVAPAPLEAAPLVPVTPGPTSLPPAPTSR